MGFYGNITNTSKTQFSFDKIYSNRKLMDDGCNTDGIYIGRYVLVEYDQEMSKDTFTSTYVCIEDKMYLNVRKDKDFLVEIDEREKVINGTKGSIILLPPGQRFSDLNKTSLYISYVSNKIIYYTKDDFNYFKTQNKLEKETLASGYIINGTVFAPEWTEETISPDSSEKKYKNPIFEIAPNHRYTLNQKEEYWTSEGGENWKQIALIVSKEVPMVGEKGEEVIVYQDTTFLANFQMDVQFYGAGRGYDSTVWQKVYVDGYEKYVMVAELNTVVPIFDIVADAPSTVPMIPHFDSDSTNIYYKLHWQPQWGLRLKSAKNNLQGPKRDEAGQKYENSSIKLTTDSIYYPSDVRTEWTGTFYNKKEKKVETGIYNTYYNDWLTENDIQVMKNKENFDTNTLLYTDVDAAVYFNKNGFYPEHIVYSSDLLSPDREAYNPNVARNGWVNKNEITITPTGLSGNIYNSHDNLIEKKPKVDIYEMSIMLPLLGDSMAKIWDLIYGGRDILPTDYRNMDIQWENASRIPAKAGLRLIEKTTFPDKISALNNKTDNINTLAGCINTLHDLIGMIIVDDTDILNAEETIYKDLETLNSSYIYYNKDEKNFFRKKTDYSYTPIELNIVEISVDQNDYAPGLFFEKNEEGKLVPSLGEYDPLKTYWQQEADLKDLYSEKELLDFMPGRYFRSYPFYGEDDTEKKNPLYEYKKDTNSQVDPGVVYYNFVSAESVTFDSYYEPNKLYYSSNYLSNDYDKDGVCYTLSSDTTADTTRIYYNIDTTTPVNLNMKVSTNYDSKTGKYEDKDLCYLYLPGYFYYKDTDINGDLFYRIENTPIETWNREYLKGNRGVFFDREYVLIDQNEDKTETDFYTRDEEGNLHKLQALEGSRINGVYSINLIPFQENKLYYSEGEISFEDRLGFLIKKPIKYCLLTENILKEHYKLQFTILKEDENDSSIFYDYYSILANTTNQFYFKNKYWYKNEGGDYVIDKLDYITPGRQYYSKLVFKEDSNSKDVYVPDKYYYYDDKTGEYIKDENLDMDLNKTYYEKNPLYVYADTKKQFPQYSEWNLEAKTIPTSITLSERKEFSILEPLDGLADNLNTVLGLILKINAMLEMNDKKTRDTQTVQGCINKINDIIAKFDRIIPGQFTIVDEYGRITSSAWTTAQSDRIVNWGKNSIQQQDIEDENHWILAQINADAINPKIYWKHSFNPVEDTITESDKNISLTGTNLGRNNNTNDTLELYSPIIDATGHVVGKNIETVTLPFAFKKLSAENSSEDGVKWSQAGGVNSSTGENVQAIVADSIADNIKIAGGNKWIRLQTSGDGADTNSKSTGLDKTNTLTIAHETHDIDTVVATATNLNNGTNTITIQDVTFDIAGHVTANKNHTYTLPYGYKTFTVGSQSTNVTDITTNTNSIIADNTQDELTVISGNKWIKMGGNNGTDTLTIAHEVHSFSAGVANTEYGLTEDKEISFLTTNNIFKVPKLKFDEAGHIIEAQDYEISITHATPGATTVSKGDTSNQTPSFGNTFKVLSAGIDQTGHVSSLEEHTVTIPKMSLTNGTGNIVTGLTLVDTTGVLTESKANVGSLALTGYTVNTDAIPDDIVATDSINNAFGKLQNKINKTILDSQTFDYQEDNAENFDSQNKTIAWLYKKVANLEKRISELEKA